MHHREVSPVTELGALLGRTQMLREGAVRIVDTHGNGNLEELFARHALQPLVRSPHLRLFRELRRSELLPVRARRWCARSCGSAHFYGFPVPGPDGPSSPSDALTIAPKGTTVITTKLFAGYLLEISQSSLCLAIQIMPEIPERASPRHPGGASLRRGNMPRAATVRRAWPITRTPCRR
jgi:hypothetical protein